MNNDRNVKKNCILIVLAIILPVIGLVACCVALVFVASFRNSIEESQIPAAVRESLTATLEAEYQSSVGIINIGPSEPMKLGNNDSRRFVRYRYGNSMEHEDAKYYYFRGDQCTGDPYLQMFLNQNEHDDESR